MQVVHNLISVIAILNCLFVQFNNAADVRVIWEQDFCPATDSHRLNNTYLPFNETCVLCKDDSLFFVNTSPYGRIDNIYSVSTAMEMRTCNATNALNSDPYIVNGTFSVLLSNVATGRVEFQFLANRRIYFISTSNGTEYSARNDKIRSGSCLQLAFIILSANCGPETCSSNSVLMEESTNLGCALRSETTQTSVSTTTPSSIPTGSSNTNQYTTSSVVSTPTQSSIPTGSSTINQSAATSAVEITLIFFLVLLTLADIGCVIVIILLGIKVYFIYSNKRCANIMIMSEKEPVNLTSKVLSEYV